MWNLRDYCEDCECFVEHTNFKEDLIEYKCLCCNKNYQKKIDESWQKRFSNTCNFSNYDINKFILLWRKTVYPYQYMDEWEKVNETSLPKKKAFHSHLNMKDITDADYTHRKKSLLKC